MCLALLATDPGRIVDEERPHRRGHQIELVHGRQTKNLLDHPCHVDLRVVGGVGESSLLDVRADDVARAAVAVDVVYAVLRVVFLNEDGRRRPNRAVANGIDKAA